MTSAAARTTAKFLALGLLAGIFLLAGKFFHFDQEQARNFFSGIPLGIAGAVYIVVYVVSSSFIWVGPKDVLRLAAVFIYGPYVSTAFIAIAEMLNLPVMFFLSRRLGRAFVEERLKGGRQKLDAAVSETGYGMIFFLRLFLLIPLRFLDLGFGLTKISFAKYFGICLLATPLRIFVVQFIWSLGVDTVMDPEKLSRYLADRPLIMWGVSIYFIGSMLMLWVMKIRAQARRIGSAVQGQI
jgi:uncharacterized membrane protein YdjX (TVP38/TMEM64 family)